MSPREFPRLSALCLVAFLSLALTACGDDSSDTSSDPCGGKCLSNQVCDQGQCVACTSNQHCATSPATPICRQSDNICVQCTLDTNCSGDLVCKNAQCVVDEGCTKDGECEGTDVCVDNACQTCRLGDCNAAGDSKCRATTIGGETSWELCASGKCEDGACTEEQGESECTAGKCHSGTARCTSAGKIENCTGDQICANNVCKDPAVTTDCTPGQCASAEATCSATGTIVNCGSDQYCSSNTCIDYCGDGKVNNGEDCDGNNLNGKTCSTLTGSSFTGGTLKCANGCTFDTSSCETTIQPSGIQAARDAAKAALDAAQAVDPTATTGTAEANIAISNAVVTYVRAALGQVTEGFFIQESNSGPAIFIDNISATTQFSPTAGDIISLTATKVAFNEVHRISKFSGAQKTGKVSDFYSKYGQDLSEVTDMMNINTYESELIDLTATIAGNFSNSGPSYKKVQIKTAGNPTASSNLVLRLPESIASFFETEAGGASYVNQCTVTVTHAIYWRYYNSVQITYYSEDASNIIIECPEDTSNYDHNEKWTGLKSAESATATFVSQDVSGITWNYTARAIGETTNNMAFTKGFVLKNTSGQNVTSPTLTKGVGDLEIAFGKGSSSNNARCIQVTANGQTYKSEPFTPSTEMLATTFKITGINAPAGSSFKIEMNKSTDDGCSGTSLMIGSIKWTNKP